MDEASAVAMLSVDAAGTIADAGDAIVLSDIDALTARMEATSEPLLFLVPARQRRAADQPLALAGLKASSPVAVISVDLPPLALAVAGNLVASCLSQAGLGAAVSLASQLEDLVLGGVLVGSVAKLDHPAPTLTQTARSLLPGSRFVVLQGLREGVEDAGRAPDTEGLVAIARGARHPSGWAADTAARWAGGAQECDLVPGPLMGNDDWAQVAWVDWTAATNQIELAADRVFDDCRWCGMPTADAGCVFCGYAGTEEFARNGGTRA